MKIEKTVKEIHKENHKWWHFPWTTWKTRWYKGGMFNAPDTEVHTEYCTRTECGWEKVTKTIKEDELS